MAANPSFGAFKYNGVSKTFDISFSFEVWCGSKVDFPGEGDAQYYLWGLGAGFAFLGDPTISSIYFPDGINPFRVHCESSYGGGLSLTASCYCDSTAFGNVVSSAPSTVAGAWSLDDEYNIQSGAISGSFSAVFDLWAITALPSAAFPALEYFYTYPYPAWGVTPPSGTMDGPPAISIIFQWRLKSGSSYSITAGGLGMSASLSGTVAASAETLQCGPQAYSGCQIQFEAAGLNGDGTPYYVNEWPSIALSATASGVQGPSSASLSGSIPQGGYSLYYNGSDTCSCSGTGVGTNYYDGVTYTELVTMGAGVGGYPKLSAQINYELLAWGDNNVDSIRLDEVYSGTTGTSRAQTFYYCNYLANLYTAQIGITRVDSPAFAFNLNHSDLVSTGNDPLDWRATIGGIGFNSFNVGQASSTQVYAAQSGLASGSRSLTPSVTDWSGYRYLSFTVSAAASGTVVIGSKTYSWTAASAGTVTIDLCMPSASVDSVQSRFPLSGGGGTGPTDGTPSGSDVNFGPSVVSSFTFSNSATIDVGAMSLTRQTSPLYEINPAFNVYRSGYSGGGTSVTLKPAIWQMTDGKCVGDWPDMGFDSSSNSILWWSCSDMCSYLGHPAGWSSTDDMPSDTWHNNNLYASWLTSPNVILGRNNFLCTPQYDVVGLAFGMQDEMAGGGGSVANINVSKQLRGKARGLVFKSDGTPKFSASIQSTDASASAGGALSDTQGIYAMGTPYGRGTHSIVTSVQGTSPLISHTDTWQNRLLVLLGFEAAYPSGASGPSHDVLKDGRHVRSYINGGTIWVGFSQDVFPLSFTDFDTSIAADSARIRFDHVRLDGRVYLIYEHSGSVYLANSSNKGVTWSVDTVATFSGTQATPRVESCANGLIYLYWLDGGAIKGEVRDSSDSVVTSSFTAIGSADEIGEVRESFGAPGGTWTLAMHYVSSGTILIAYSHDGVHFS